MGNTGDKIKGHAEELAGKVKKNVGDAIDNEQMQAEGKAQEMKGHARHEAAEGAERAKGAGEELKGNIKQGVGDMLGNEQMQAEGKAEELKGEARQKANQ